MDEVEALAQRATVISRGRIVATGTPASLGGRDRGAATIRFTLPEGTDPGALPVAPQRVEGQAVEIRTDDELRVLAPLVNWALAAGLALSGLTVSRLTLEDVYLELTQDESAAEVEARR